MLFGFYGVLGSGKSVSATALALYFKDKGYTIYPNYEIYNKDKSDTVGIPLPAGKIVDNNWIPETQSVIVMDEIDRYMDARRSVTKSNIALDRLFRHLRKLKTHLIFTTHFRYIIEKRIGSLIRNGWGYEIDCSNVENDEGNVEYIIWDVIDFTKEIPVNSRYCFNPVPFFNRYDTDEIIEGFGL